MESAGLCHHSGNETFYNTARRSEQFNSETMLDFEGRCCSVSNMIELLRSIRSFSTSTPSAYAARRGENDSGLDDDSFSSDLAVSRMSNLYLHDRDDVSLIPSPTTCRFCDDGEDTTGGLESRVPSIDHETDRDDDDSTVPEQYPVIANAAFTRCSPSRRLRSPVATVVERRLRHRLSLDAYEERRCLREDESSLSSSLESLSVDSLLGNESSVDSMVELTLTRLAPPCLDRLIGRKMGLGTVDVIAELSCRSMGLVIDKILSYLSGSDLSQMSMVCSSWHSAVHGSKPAVVQLTAFICNKRTISTMEMQNSSSATDSVTTSEEEDHQLAVKDDSRDPLVCVQLKQPTRKPHSSRQKRRSLAERYWEEAQKLRNDERLSKCPHCSSPSRTDSVQERAFCTKSECSFDFCTRCLSLFHGSVPCRSATIRPGRRSDPLVGSRRSLHNLRRL